MMNIEILNKYNIYITGYPERVSTDKYIVYLPLVGYAEVLSSACVQNLCAVLSDNTVAAESSTKHVISHLNDKRLPIYWTPASSSGLYNMMILPNNICNFKCTYCYSAFGRSGKMLSMEKLKSAICYFFRKNRSYSDHLTVSILGGGEPLLSWDLLRESLDYLYGLEHNQYHKTPVSLVTNGSIWSQEIADYCVAHNICLSVSFDIIKEIQDKQRGHYSQVIENINKYSDVGLDVALNTVITNDNVNLMDKMLDTMELTIPKVKKVSFKPIISNEYFDSIEERDVYYCHFVNNFFEAMDEAEKKGIYLTTPYLNNAQCLSDRYCPGKFVITAEGTISICHCVSSSKDRLYDKFIYGKITDDGNIILDEEKLGKILAHNQNFRKACDDCIARWHCAGGCYADMCTITDEAIESYCRSMQCFMQKYLVKHYRL